MHWLHYNERGNYYRIVKEVFLFWTRTIMYIDGSKLTRKSVISEFIRFDVEQRKLLKRIKSRKKKRTHLSRWWKWLHT